MREIDCVAGILIGGESSRFGRPKALERLPCGETALEHVITTARSVAGEVVLLGQSDEVAIANLNCQQLADPPETVGPMAGLASLLSHAKNRWALLLACDLPLIESELFSPLIAAARTDSTRDVIAYETGIPHRPFYTCCTLYHPRILQTVEAAVERGEFRLQGILQSVRTQSIIPNDAQKCMLQDMNTPEDKSRLLD